MNQMKKKGRGRPSGSRRESNLDLDNFIGRKIAGLRHAIGLSQEELAASVSCHYASIGKIEVGEKSISLGLLFDVLYALDADEATFLAIVREDMRLRAVSRV
ncbi:helix-turn-helix domain-containing protein [Acetobacter sp. DsW_063]|uniref:helix-turn-helix domain-containing protein n=1 Tax=Acetobacter sp. DsW_063 TaxID=1514894 RepID=UPI000A36FE54|nr:helix-turn-helix transcriptional regulator [Acetobacter sp. DsW_063]OUJ17088.1 hypothetical protein HK28_07935 [Acetobacter sp. DsW_063]